MISRRHIVLAILLIFQVAFAGWILVPTKVSAASIGPTEYYCDWSEFDGTPSPQAAINTSIFEDQGTAQCSDFMPIREGRSDGGQSFIWTFSCPGATVPTLTPNNNSDGVHVGFTAQCGGNPATITEESNFDPNLRGVGCADGTIVYGSEDELDTICDAHGGRVGALEGDCSDFSVGECGILSYVLIFINILSAVVGVIVVVMIVIGGIQYASARDNANAVSAARGRITNAVIALIFYLGITAFLQWVVPGGVFSG